MKIENADKFFAASGFWQQMAPYMIGTYAFLCGIGVFSLNHGLDNRKLAIILGLVFLLIPVPQFVRYRLAARKHFELKERYGDRYTRLVEEGQVPINPAAVLVLGSPGKYVQRLIPSDDHTRS